MDSFLHNHQSALDSFMEDKAIQDLEDADIYPDSKNYPNVFENSILIEDEDYEPTDEEMLSSFGTKWHDGL